LPRTLLHALEAFDADPISGKAFGDFYKGVYLSHKQKEWEQTFYRVTEEQRRELLTFI
jgi:glutamine synthetase